jgi:anti-sigma B factor antagonist
MGVKIDEYNHVCVIEVDGDFTGGNAQRAREVLEEQTHQKRVAFVLDLAKCSFIDSEGLETLLAMKRRSEDLYGQIKLARLDDNCRTILQLTRLEHRFESHDDLNAALKTMH